MALIFTLTVAWTGLITWAKVSSGNQEGIAGTAIAIVSAAAPASPLIIIYAILTISAIDVAGGLTVVTARYLTDKFLKPRIEKRRAEAHAEGLAEGLTEGLAEGRAEERREWTDWNRRRLEAEANGAPFDEPPPAS